MTRLNTKYLTIASLPACPSRPSNSPIPRHGPLHGALYSFDIGVLRWIRSPSTIVVVLLLFVVLAKDVPLLGKESREDLEYDAAKDDEAEQNYNPSRSVFGP